MPIPISSYCPPQELYYEDRHYHEHCFRCFRCDRSLADEPFTCQDEELLCNDCYCNEFSSKCIACEKTVMPGRSRRALWFASSPIAWGCRVQCQGSKRQLNFCPPTALSLHSVGWAQSGGTTGCDQHSPDCLSVSFSCGEVS